MNAFMMETYGLTDRFAALAGMYPELTACRIVSQEKGLYHLASQYGEKMGEISGKFRYQAAGSSDYPAVGDFVMADWNEGGHAVIRHILSRKSCFVRKAAGESREEQIVAANIDTVFVCMSLNQNYNLRRLERYLAIAWDSGAVPVVVLTKADLCDDLPARIGEVSAAAMGADVLITSAVARDGYAQVLPYLSKGKTAAFLGSSGVGKSTLINCLLGEGRQDTRQTGSEDKGRHTTTRRELIRLPGGAMVIDTPGMRELGMWDSDSGIDLAFAEIEEAAERCRFRDCTHTSEPGCAVRRGIEEGSISYDRWLSYRKLKMESAYAADSESYLAVKEKKFKEIAITNKNNRRRR